MNAFATAPTRQTFRSTFVMAALIAATPPAEAATRSVGAGQPYRTIASAVAAAQDGDVVRVQAGTYVNDFATVSKRISIVGVGGMARLVATVPPPNGKAILTTTTDVTLEHLELTGARVADRNGAGVRYEGGALVIRRCYIHGNEDGVLGGSWPNGTVEVRGSEFARNGIGDGYTHGLYIGQIASLLVNNSYFHHQNDGSHIKSRALRTVITNNRIVDGVGGTASYNIDLSNGGAAIISGNRIEQGASSPNYHLISFATESAPYPGSSLKVTGNLLQNLRSSAVGILNRSQVVASITSNRLYRLPNLVSGPSSQSGNTVLGRPVAIGTASPWRTTKP